MYLYEGVISGGQFPASRSIRNRDVTVCVSSRMEIAFKSYRKQSRGEEKKRMSAFFVSLCQPL